MTSFPPAGVGAAFLLESLLGFREEPTRRAEIEDAFEARVRARGLSGLEAYARLLDEPPLRAEEARIVAATLTVNETYFFRESEHLDALREVVVPRTLGRGAQPLRVLSLGCSTGEEPYGIAMTLVEAGVAPSDFSIHACDVNPSAIARAERATYSPWSLRKLPDALRGRYFRPAEKNFQLVDGIRALVRFEVRNVVEPDADFWRPASFDAVFCRNMLIYLTPAVIRGLVTDVTAALSPGGHLFLAHSETSHAGAAFVTEEWRGAFFFRRRDAAAESTPSAENAVRPPDSAGWRESIERSAERLRALALVPERTVDRGEDDVEAALALVAAERFTDALEALGASPRTAAGQLVRGAALLHLGLVEDARLAAEACLALDARSAEAHYLLGLEREHAGLRTEARAHHARAALLDERFAMPRLRAGLLAKRAGESDEARLLLREALHTLRRQSRRASLLFCGSFPIEHLEDLCRSEIAACTRKT